jgi:flagellar basal-body rod protein FlgB
LEVNMPFDIDTALGIHPQALAVRARRAEILAANIANADTPNYKARDIDFRALLGGASTQPLNTRLVATNAAHLSDAAAAAPLEAGLMYRMPQQPSIDGNTVDPQMEYSQFAQNALQYQSSLTFLNNRIKNLMTAIRGD